MDPDRDREMGHELLDNHISCALLTGTFAVNTLSVSRLRLNIKSNAPHFDCKLCMWNSFIRLKVKAVFGSLVVPGNNRARISWVTLLAAPEHPQNRTFVAWMPFESTTVNNKFGLLPE